MTDKEAWVRFASARATGEFARYVSEVERATTCIAFADEMLSYMQAKFIRVASSTNEADCESEPKSR